MAILTIVKTPDPTLRSPTKRVGIVDKKITNLIRDMADTLSAQTDPEGVGLAAPQVGLLWRIFLMKPTRKSPITVFINPEIKKNNETHLSYKSPESHHPIRQNKMLEGCLSIPNYYSNVMRHPEITITFRTLDRSLRHPMPQPVTVRYKGMRAQIVQHELDHLNGVLFIDHVLTQKRPLYKVEGEQWKEVKLGEV
jgi:peptide deformylase